MAFLEQRGEWYRIVFTFGGKRYSHSVHTVDKRTADAIRGGIDRTILQIRQRLLIVPDGADVKEFILTGGQSAGPPVAPEPATQPAPQPARAPEQSAPAVIEPLTLARLKEKYVAAQGIKGLKFPKTTEKPPFQTWAEIERQVAHSYLDEAEQQALWNCLFLGPQEIDDLLAFVKTVAIQPWVFPMFFFAAHTGTRRSEMIRARLADLDLDGGSVRVLEKKRTRGHRTSRRVPLSASLTQVLRDWLSVHPGGPFLFAQNGHVFRSKKKRGGTTPITCDEAHDHFKRSSFSMTPVRSALAAHTGRL